MNFYTSLPIRKIIYNLTIILISAIVYSQDPAPQLSSYVPVSPNAASLGKFGIFPVNYNLGTVNIGVPIYTINTGKQQLPISLSYHSSGIKVNELASWVGLGWTLNSGGAIIRNTKGIADPNLGTPSIPDLYNYAYNENNYLYLYNVFTGKRDAAPDEFVINAPGLSGTFIFDQNNNNKAVFRDYNQVKVDVISNAKIKVTREDGTILFFGTGADNSDATEVLHIPSGNIPSTNPIMTWYLTEMISPNSDDVISFKYKNKYSADYPVATGESATFGPTANGSINGSYPSQLWSDKKYLEKIEFNNGYILFNSSLTRPDLADEYQLDNINVYFEESVNNTTLVEEYTFDYDSFTRSGGSYPSGSPQGEYFNTPRMKNSREEALKLNGVIIGKGGVGHEYSFDYNTTTLPLRGSKRQDFWGYANNNSGDLIISTNFDLYDNLYNYTNYNVGNGNRKADPIKMKAASLEKITYPTEGYTEFIYDVYKYNATDYIGGLRIDSIKNYDGVQSTPMSIKTFGFGTANILQPINSNSYIKKFLYHSYIPLPHATVSSNTHYNNNIGGVPIVEYGSVTEYDLNTTTLIDNGKTVYTYQTIVPIRLLTGNFPVIYKHASATFYAGAYQASLDQVQDLNDFSYYQSDLWQYGSLTKKEVFKRTTNVPNPYIIQSSTENVYTTLGSSTLKSNVVFPIMMDPYDQWEDFNSNYYNSFQFNYFIEETSLGKKALTQTIEKLYDENGTNYVETTTNLSYNNRYLLSESSTTDSQNKTKISKTYYPDDVLTTSTLLGSNLSPPEKLAIDKLKKGDQHRISRPIQVENYLDANNDGITDSNELLGLQRTNFKDWGQNGSGTGNIILPETIETSKGNSDLEPRIIYHDYDNKGNPLEVSKTDGTHIYYIWGYQQTQPIAKLENFTSADAVSIQNLIDAAVSASNADIDQASEESLRTALNAIRNSLPDAQVTTYTYDPLIGVTSITDPRDYTIYYEYDDFNRLKQVKDAEGNILSKNEYHYKNQ